MNYYLLSLTILAFVMLLILSAIKPKHSRLNMFELERRSEKGDAHAKKALNREKLLGDVVSLQRVLIALLNVVVVLLSELTFGLVVGIIVALLIALEYGAIARFKFIKKLSQKLYERIEDPILEFVKNAPLFFIFVRSSSKDDMHDLHFDSREELQHLVAESDDVLTSEEKKLIVNSLGFNDRQVKTAMTPKDHICYVKRSEYLGPLALDELHKIGHSRLPVVSTDINHIVGILHLEGLLTLNVKRSTTAEKAMEPKVYYIRQDQTLQHALAAFLRTKHHLFIVVNSDKQTVGLLALKDVIEALLGREIIDEFDNHDNLREVALRDLHGNNNPTSHKDV